MADEGMNVNRTERDGVDPGQIDLLNRDPKDLNGHLSVSVGVCKCGSGQLLCSAESFKYCPSVGTF